MCKSYRTSRNRDLIGMFINIRRTPKLDGVLF